MKFLDSFLQLIFPNICLGCGGYLSYQEKHLCTLCHYSLPRFEQIADPKNQVAKVFWGRTNVQEASALLKFETSNLTQTVLHQFKYRKNIKLGYLLGNMMANALIKHELFKTIDFVIPVPLHPKKENQRGFNQSKILCNGFIEVHKRAHYVNALRRTSHSSSQTKKSRFARYQNTKDIFQVNEPESLINKHVLIIDDVITTGATTIACIEALKNIEGIRISVFCLAFST